MKKNHLAYALALLAFSVCSPGNAFALGGDSQDVDQDALKQIPARECPRVAAMLRACEEKYKMPGRDAKTVQEFAAQECERDIGRLSRFLDACSDCHFADAEGEERKKSFCANLEVIKEKRAHPRMDRTN